MKCLLTGEYLYKLVVLLAIGFALPAYANQNFNSDNIRLSLQNLKEKRPSFYNKAQSELSNIKTACTRLKGFSNDHAPEAQGPWPKEIQSNAGHVQPVQDQSKVRLFRQKMHIKYLNKANDFFNERISSLEKGAKLLLSFLGLSNEDRKNTLSLFKSLQADVNNSEYDTCIKKVEYLKKS